MSAQGGIFYTDARPVPDAVVARLTQALSGDALDGVGCHREPGLAIAHGALHVTPEDERIRLPLVTQRNTVATWDGRLDNRGEIIDLLGAPSSVADSDAELACAVYERWGVPGLARLIGDWSLAIYDASTQSVVLASDFMGVRPLYYHCASNRFAWCSDLGFLTAVTDAFEDLEPRYVAGFLMWGTPPELTPFRGIVSVPGAHAVTFQRSGRLVMRRFWDFSRNRIRYRRQTEYDEHLVSCFRDAVAGRLRTARPAWVQLSGGLDSSSMTCMAAALIRERRVDTPALRTVTYVSAQSPEWNERPFVQAVEEHCGLRTTVVDLDDYPPFLTPTPFSPDYTHASDIVTQQLMRQTGARVLLNGRMGDAVMGHRVDNVESATDALVTFRLWSYFRELYRWALIAQLPLIEALSLSLVPMLPSRLQEWLDVRRMLTRQANVDPQSRHDDAALLSIERRFLKSVGPTYPSFARLARSKTLPGHRQLLTMLYRSAMQHRLRPLDGMMQAFLTYPYVDRRLVEFSLAIPSTVLYEPGQSRALMRRAFSSFTPARVLKRFSKGYYAPAVLRHLRPAARALLPRVADLHVVRRGYVNAASLERRFVAVLNGSSLKTGNLVNIVRLEAWFDVREQSAMRHAGVPDERVPFTQTLQSIPL